ncbi:MAG: hypothetical protein SF052_03710 [Bacteroidia bacterium]|nr:hypothetical protein [Bacteroidia bacterium]
MLFTQTLSQLVSQEQDFEVLQKKSPAKPYIRSLQMLLYSLGFGTELNWEKYRADGDYGGGTTTAMLAFLTRNKLPGNGETADSELLTLMLERYKLLPALRMLKTAVDKGNVATTYDSTQLSPEAIKGLKALFQLAGINYTTPALSPDQAKTLLAKITPLYGEGWFMATDVPAEGQRRSETEIQPVGEKTFEVSDSWLKAKFIRVKKKDETFYPGIATIGNDRPSDFILTHKKLLIGMGLSESALRVILPVSANEGNLDAINTWDNAFLTFGMFQWTIGTESSAGELPAFLQRVKDKFPDTFDEYYGRYGIGLADTTKTTGFMTFNGSKMQTPAQKEQFRDMAWAFRFWKAGLDAKVQTTEVMHAIDRINSFIEHKSYRPLDKFFIGDLITSEYGMSLILDHHVNRPGHLMSFSIGKTDILGHALRNAGLENTNPKEWKTPEEMKLLDAYLSLRYASNMTDSQHRAERIKGCLDRGELSGERHSFVMETQRSRGFFMDTEDEYPVVNFEEYEMLTESA